jgi:HEPN domain-containing protein
MPPDERALEVGAWLARAHDDLRAARLDVTADPPLSADAAFHCQQAVEKALKALLCRHDHPFRKTHDIGELAVACLQYEPALEGLLRSAAPLTEYAWRFRYPGDLFEPDLDEVAEALDIADRVVGAVSAAVDD